MATGQSEITLRFLAAPTDVATLGGSIHGGRVLEWIDKSAYALAVGWSGGYCVTAYVGDIRFARLRESGHCLADRIQCFCGSLTTDLHGLGGAVEIEPTNAAEPRTDQDIGWIARKPRPRNAVLHDIEGFHHDSR